MRTFFTSNDQITFLRCPSILGNNDKGFEFVYEYVSAKKTVKDPSKLLVEAMIKVNCNSYFEAHKKIYPKLMYFYHLLKADAPIIYYSVFRKIETISGQGTQSEGLIKGAIAPLFNDRRDRMTPSEINVG